MDPITIAVVGTMALGSLAQLYSSEKARGAEKGRLEEIAALYNSIKPPNYDLTILDPPEMHEQMLNSPAFSGEIAPPKFNLDKLTPEQFKQVQQYIPQAAPFIAEAAPKLIEQSVGMKAGKDAQMAALKKFMDVGNSSTDPEYEEAITKAGRQAQTEAQSRQASILQDFARRGQSGSGLNLAAQIGGTSQAMDRNAMANMSAASQAYKNRLQALSQGAELGGQISQQDQNLQAQNNAVINAFNQRMSTNQQQYQNQRAGMMNDAQKYNVGMQQDLANMNTQAANQYSLQNQQRNDQLAKYGYDAANQAQQRQDALTQWQRNQQNSANAYNNQLAMQNYNMSNANLDKINNLKRQSYQDALQQAAGISGNAIQMNNADIGQAQDRNAAIQGLANAGMIYGQQSMANNNAAKTRASNADLAYYKQNGQFMPEDDMNTYKSRYGDY